MMKITKLLTAAMLASPFAAQADTTILFNNFLGSTNGPYTNIVQP